MKISDLSNNMLSLVNELRLVNSTATPETFPGMLHEVLLRHDLEDTLSDLEQG